MGNDGAILITGTGDNSLGEKIVAALKRAYIETPIVALDLKNSSVVANCDRTLAFDINLNPLEHEAGYEGVTNDVQRAIEDAQRQFQFRGIGIMILAAGVYAYGDIDSTSLEARQAVAGVNLCGKVEIIRAVLELNTRLAFSSEEMLSVVDVGSLHGLSASGGRALYAATKTFGLDLCLSLLNGREINRMIHVAPGPIDTHMLHRNHWISKVGGSREFFEYVREQHADKYANVFIRCNKDVFNEIAAKFSDDNAELVDVFRRYKERRARQMTGDNAVLNPVDVATVIVDMLRDSESGPKVVCKIKATDDHVQTHMLSVDQVIRHGFDAE